MKRVVPLAMVMGLIGGLSGYWFGWWAIAVTFPLSVVVGIVFARHNERRQQRVADRQAREDRGDPGPGEGAGADAFATGTLGPVPDATAIERTQQAEPLRGWKAATLEFRGGTFCFGPITGKQPYVAEEAWAQCEDGYRYSYREGGPRPHSQGPVLECSCGFYAWKDRANVESSGLGLAVLEVDLYGTVIECENGYRAGKQRVLSAEIVGRCMYCSKDATVVGLIGEGTPLLTARLVPLCLTHSGEARVSIERDELGSLLGTEVRWRETK